MMNMVYRAWRFNHPDFDDAALQRGIGVANTGGIAMVEGNAAVRQAILLLLTTTPGERVMRPDYGCDLQQLVFSPNDETTHGLAIHYVRQALERWEPRVDIIKLDANENVDDAGRMDITLEYRVRKTVQHDALTFSMALVGEEG